MKRKTDNSMQQHENRRGTTFNCIDKLCQCLRPLDIRIIVIAAIFGFAPVFTLHAQTTHHPTAWADIMTGVAAGDIIDLSALPEDANTTVQIPTVWRSLTFHGSAGKAFTNFAIRCSIAVKLTIKDLEVISATSPLAFSGSASQSFELVLEGVNKLTNSQTTNIVNNGAAIVVFGNMTLTISGSGSLTATGGYGGTGIGGNNGAPCGTVIINSGTVQAKGGSYAAGIGGGYNGGSGTISINGGKVEATGGIGAAGVGGGQGWAGGTITISGNAEVTAVGGAVTGDDFGGGAGIGGGAGWADGATSKTSGASGNITISGAAKVTATGGASDKNGGGAGIGSGGAGGHNETTPGTVGSVGTIVISTTETVTATGGTGGTGATGGNGANVGLGGGGGVSGVNEIIDLANAKYITFANIATDIEAALAFNPTVYVINNAATAFNAGSNTLTINIPATKTVEWNADYTGSVNNPNTLITLPGEGIFKVTGGSITHSGTGSAIQGANASGTVMVSGGTVSSTSGTAIWANPCTVRVNGGTVSATLGNYCIFGGGTGGGSNVYVSAGVVQVGDGVSAICLSSGTLNVYVSGGTVSATTRNAIVYAKNTEVSGGTVSATTGLAIVCTINNTVNISGGFVFAYGSKIMASGGTNDDAVIGVASGTFNLNSGGTDNGVVVAWANPGGSPQYNAGTSDNLSVSAGATAVWGKNGTENGIQYAYGSTNTGFFALPVNTFMQVTNITGVTTTATAGVDLTLTGTVVPTDATNKTIVWSVSTLDAGTTGASITGNTLHTTAAGTATIRATITDGVAAGTDYSKDFTITVSTEPVITSGADVTVVNGVGGDFQLTATGSMPITWSLSGEPAGVTVNSATGLMSIAATTAAGTHTFTVTASNSTLIDATQTFTLTVAPVVPPLITGDSEMTLATGYGATATNAYAITGYPAATVTKISGDAHIVWNGLTQKLDIAAGLPAGIYPVELKASNVVAPDMTFTFTLHVVPAIFGVAVSATGGGTVATDKTTAQEGETVTLSLTPHTGYELTGLSAPTAFDTYQSGNATIYKFSMPANDVTVKATFQKTAAQSVWETVKDLIENGVFTLTQAEAPDVDAARYRLAGLINALLAGSGFTVSPYDIVIYLFTPAVAGDATKTAGTAGYFEFRVTPANVTPSAYGSGAITPTDLTRNDVVGEHAGSPLRAWVQNGVLNVGGLAPGATWQVYTLTGALIYTGIVPNAGANLGLLSNVEVCVCPLPSRGIYLIRCENQSVKVMY